MSAVEDLCLSVISHGHGPLVRRLLGQLDEQHRLAGVKVVLTLNLPDESLREQDYPNLNLQIVRNAAPKGFGANHNAAFAMCESRWFAILNPDLSLVGDEPFTPMLARLQAQAPTHAIGLLAPRVVAGDMRAEDSVRSNLTPWSLLRRAMGDKRPLQVREDARPGSPFFWVAGMCLLARADAYRQLGGFDERFFLYCEDYDICARFYNAGFAIRLDEQARIIHDAQRDSHRRWGHLRWHLSSLLKVWTSQAFWRVTFSSAKSS